MKLHPYDVRRNIKRSDQSIHELYQQIKDLLGKWFDPLLLSNHYSLNPPVQFTDIDGNLHYN